MVERDAGLIVEVTDGDTLGYRGNLFCDLAKNAVIRLAYALAADLHARAGQFVPPVPTPYSFPLPITSLSNMDPETMRPTIARILLLLTLLATQACGAGTPADEALQTEVAAALDSLVAELAADRPADAAAYAERLQAYLENHPEFYGSAAALMDAAGTVTASPYVYRSGDGYQTLDLARPDYDIEAQEWITLPLAADKGIWTPPYFDEGGGEIWMITRSVPVRDDEGVFAIVTTDLPVDEPGG